MLWIYKHTVIVMRNFRHEALVAAIAEKDAHIALLEQSRERPREEIETLRHHKEKLMEKLKEENERRAQLLSSTDLTVGKRSESQVVVFKE